MKRGEINVQSIIIMILVLVFIYFIFSIVMRMLANV